MPAIAADELGVAGARGDVAETVRREEADEGVPNLPADELVFQKRMSAEAGVFDEPVAFGDGMHVMAEQTARVAHFLVERLALREPVVTGVEHEGMSAPDADILMMSLPRREPYVGVVAKEAGKRVADAGQGPVFCQVSAAAPASPVCGG